MLLKYDGLTCSAYHSSRSDEKERRKFKIVVELELAETL